MIEICIECTKLRAWRATRAFAFYAPSFYVPYLSYLPSFFGVPYKPRSFTSLMCFDFLLALIFLCVLRGLTFWRAYKPSFFTCLFFLRTCVPFLRAVHAFYLRASAFLVYLQIFYLPLFLLSALSFSLTLLFFIFLHALRCLNFSSQMSNKGGKGDIDFFIFLDPFKGNKDLFRVFQLRNYFFFRYYVFFQVDNKHLDGNIFLTLVITSRGLPYFEKICMHWN